VSSEPAVAPPGLLTLGVDQEGALLRAASRVPEWAWLAFALSAYVALLAYSGFLLAPGGHDNDWPLLMWLANHASLADPSPLAVGHYGFLQLILVRVLYPLLGNTLTAAKTLNIVAVVAAAVALFRTVRLVTRGRLAPWFGVALFLSSYETFLTAQSEFGDPLALACFAVGLMLVLEGPGTVRTVAAGALWGLCSSLRVHYQFFALAAVVAFAGYAHARRREDGGWVARVTILAAGVVVGQMPVFVLNLWAHGTPFSPIADTFVGQVLFGINNYDLPGTYAAHPMREVLSDHKLLLAGLIRQRLLEFPLPWLVALGLGLGAVFHRDGAQHGRALVWLLAVGYYVGFVTLAWDATPRLLLPLAFLASASAAAGIDTVLALARSRRAQAVLLAVVGGLWVAGKLPGDRAHIRDTLADSRQMWRSSNELTITLRGLGLAESREAFVFDWNRYLTDDPELTTFYNFGFWDLLCPAFAAERPNPFPYIRDPPAFARFVRDRGVRFLVLPRELPQVFEAFTDVSAGTAKLEGFEHAVTLRSDIVLFGEPGSSGIEPPAPLQRPSDNARRLPGAGGQVR
jgi:hypothetical protein